jgi:hypothetical protein
MYLMGHTPPLANLIFAQGTQPFGVPELIDIVGKNFIPIAIGTVGAIFLSGFSAMFVIPAFILTAVFNLLFIPSADLISGQCMGGGVCIPGTVQVIINIFLNLIVLLGIMEYISGGR